MKTTKLEELIPGDWVMFIPDDKKEKPYMRIVYSINRRMGHIYVDDLFINKFSIKTGKSLKNFMYSENLGRIEVLKTDEDIAEDNRRKHVDNVRELLDKINIGKLDVEGLKELSEVLHKIKRSNLMTDKKTIEENPWMDGNEPGKEQSQKLKKINGRWVDENNNSWYGDLSEEDAIYTSQQLKNCYNCEDCTRCENCNACKNCTDCEDCTDCIDCADCEDCTNCIDCEDCGECNDCKGNRSCQFCNSHDRCEYCAREETLDDKLDKKIYPEWVKISERKPNKKDGEYVYVYSKKHGKLSLSLCYFCVVTPYDYWAKIDIHDIIDSNGLSKFVSDKLVATPKECNAHKLKEFMQEQKEINEADKDCKEILDDNPWIKGNKPEKDDTYYITLSSGEVFYDEYSEGSTKTGWSRDNDIVIAYANIPLKDPYIPSNPERELICPFCESKNIAFYAGGGFSCNYCKAELPNIITKEQIFNLYNKLNGDYEKGFQEGIKAAIKMLKDFKEKKMKRKAKMKLFIWEDFCPDYTSGISFAIAKDETDAKEQVTKEHGIEPHTWGTLSIHRLDWRIARAISGGS